MNNNPICEDAPCCGCCGVTPGESEYDPREEIETGWPGDGSGTDDLADFNAMEANDYANEGAEDSHLDSDFEDRISGFED